MLLYNLDRMQHNYSAKPKMHFDMHLQIVGQSNKLIINILKL